MPNFIVRLVMGEMGEEFALASRRAQAGQTACRRVPVPLSGTGMCIAA